MKTGRTADQIAPLWTEEGRPQEGWIAEVAPALPIERTYSFAVPAEMEPSLRLGQRVRVPMGRRGRAMVGFVVALNHGPWESTLRPIDSLVDDQSYLTPDLLELGREIAAHYACPLGVTLKAMVPEAVRQQAGLTTVRYARLVEHDAEGDHPAIRMSAKRRAILDRLAASKEALRVDALLAETGASNEVLRSLVRAGQIEIVSRKETPDPQPLTLTPDPFVFEPPFELTAEQQNALSKIHAEIGSGRFSVTLMYGVSGSGKTEVYIRAMRRAVETGRQAILLVPEIVLTTQLMQRLVPRLPNVAVLHSALTDVQRSRLWRRIASGESAIVLGTRSAVFAPCPNPGLICVDEEQEPSFKNLQAPRFHVRDAAILRARRHNIPIVLGSATPSMETWYNAKHRRHYQRVDLPRRVNERPMPRIHVVDMRDEFLDLRRAVPLSRTTERLLGEALDRGEQAMLLVNRRGFAHRIFCPRCRARLVCPNCNVGLVAHTTTGEAICHYCRNRMPTPTVCPNVSCGEKLMHVGMGTQRVEEALARGFPDAKVQRVDSDTMRHRREYERILSDFEARKIDVLVGTQMIAKGLDFPFISFVCVVHADPVAPSADFRSVERLFQLLTQVAGRAGRGGTGGEVVIQTTMPELSVIRHALRHDYPAFAEEELLNRRKVGLPPFRRLARIVVAHAREETARIQAQSLAGRIREIIAQLAAETGSPDPGQPPPVPTDVFGPAPCLLSRLRGKYRYELLLRSPDAGGQHCVLQELTDSGVLRKHSKSLVVDVDPVSLM